ncbi:ATP-binding protein [Paenibacillus sp. HJGM_3]|uniref:hybrid sensor histidine kinase/response regulator n=1 Tax=Paenibacillus sp. HJGM_3 TaxID=3379816 RepID=UPI00385B6B0E
MRKWAALLIVLAMLACTYGMIPVILKHVDNGAPLASRGTMDLSHWSFSEQGVAALDGEWEFYPDRLLDSADFGPGGVAGTPTPDFVAVPGSWKKKMDTLGYATYRLQVNVADAQGIYGLKTLSIQMSGRVFVNGQLVGESGVPAEEKRTYSGKNKPIVGYFTLKPGLNEIIVQVANYHSPASSGINHPMFLGDSKQIASLQSKALARDWVMFTSYVIMGLYFIGLYTQRRADYNLIVFGLLSLCFAAFMSTTGERIIYDLFGELPVELFLRVQILSAILAAMALLLYVNVAFRPFVSNRLIRVSLVIGGLLALAELFAFTTIQTGGMRLFVSLYSNLPFIYAIYVLMLAALHRVEGSFYLVVAGVALNVHAFTLNMNVYLAVPTYTFPPIEPFIYLLMLALLMSLRFSNAFKKIEQLSGRLIQADKLKDEFLTKTAHEFKTPLHGMISIAQSLLADPRHPLSKEQQETVGLISAIGKRLSQLVYDILDLSRLRQGELKVDPVPIDVRSTVGLILKMFDFIKSGKPLELVNEVPDQLPYVLADEIRFRQIICNLLDNAIKHTACGRITVSAREKGSMIEISVRDTGIGMEEHDLSVIFDPYRSLETDTTHNFGLGLPIVKQLVELQRGDIWVHSAKGEGSTFTFTMPAAGREILALPRPSRSPDVMEPAVPAYSFATPYMSAHSGGPVILAADDHFSNLKVLIDTLERLDYTVIAVKDGFEALEQLERRPVDLVILDLMMPGMSGLEVCDSIRSRYTLLELPVLMVTASIQPEDKIAAFEAGANDYLPKPFDTAELQARTKSLLTMKESVGKLIDMEVAFLQSQIKPHFLFNVLNTILSLTYRDVEQARKLTIELADYLRGSFSFNNLQKGVPFSSELALIQSYAEIEKMRFLDSVQVKYDIAEETQHVKIPPLLLQPLVENAIRHGIGRREDGGTVIVRAYRADEHVIFEIEDDGVGMTQERLDDALAGESFERQGARSGVGLKNISKRLKFAYGAALQVQSSVGAGTKVTIRIPAESA